MKKTIFFLIILTSVFNFIKAQETYTPVTSESIFNIENEVYFSFKINDQSEKEYYSAMVDYHIMRSDSVFAYASRTQFSEFLSTGKPYTLRPYYRPINPKMFGPDKIHQFKNSRLVWDAYPTYAAYEAMMVGFAIDYPLLCTLDTILDSTSNYHSILALKISDNVNTTENEPQFLYASSIHGNELTGYITLLRLADFLLSNYGTNSRVTNLVNNVEIWICPLFNPDGTYNPSDNDISLARRGNYTFNPQTGTYFDLNRNYPDPRYGNPTTHGPIQLETQAFIDFAKQHNLNMAVHFHDGAQLVNYPWETWSTGPTDNHQHPDYSWWQYISNIYADSVQLNSGALGASYFTDENDGVTNGGDWVPISGGQADYLNFFHQSRGMSIELSSFLPAAGSTLPQYWYAHINSLLKLMEHSQKGIRGIIKDSCTGLPMRARVFVNGHDLLSDSSFVNSSTTVGNYHRYLTSGTYSITYSSPGYASRIINNISLISGQTAFRNVALLPNVAPTVNFIADKTFVCEGDVQFTNLTTGAIGLVTWNFGDGQTSSQLNPTHQYVSNGAYTVTLTVSNCIGLDTEIKSGYIIVNLSDAYNLVSDTSCSPSILNLSAAGNGTIKWFDAPTLGNCVATGTTYATPFLSSSTTYYVQDEVLKPLFNAGKTDTSGGGSFTTTGNRYLIFDAYKPLILESVKIFGRSPTAPGNKTIELTNSSGTVLASTTVFINSGLNIVPLNFQVPAQTNLRLTGVADGIYRNNAGVSYPYTTPGLLSITNSSSGSGFYYFFYDWKVREEGCISQREPVYAVILGQPIAGFSSAINTNTVNFTNNSIDAVNSNWDFGDGSNSNIANPTHAYANTGNYNVTLFVSNNCGSDSISHQITISSMGGVTNSEAFSSIQFYPNPATNILMIDLGEPSKNKITVAIFTPSGSKVFEGTIEKDSRLYGIPLNEIPKGLYLVRIMSEEENFVFRFIKE